MSAQSITLPHSILSRILAIHKVASMKEGLASDLLAGVRLSLHGQRLTLTCTDGKLLVEETYGDHGEQPSDNLMDVHAVLSCAGVESLAPWAKLKTCKEITLTVEPGIAADYDAHGKLAPGTGIKRSITLAGLPGIPSLPLEALDGNYPRVEQAWNVQRAKTADRLAQHEQRRIGADVPVYPEPADRFGVDLSYMVTLATLWGHKGGRGIAVIQDHKCLHVSPLSPTFDAIRQRAVIMLINLPEN